MDKANSQLIAFLRFPLTFLVVVIHCRGTLEPIADWSHLNAADFYHIVKVLFSDGIAQIGVPSFFFISGYLFFHNITKLDTSVYRQKLSSRIRTLFVPYVLWNLLCIPLTMLVCYGESLSGTSASGAALEYWNNMNWPHILWDYTSHDDVFLNLLGMKLLISGPVLGTFWYVRDLIIITILSPLVYWFFKKTGKIGAVVVLVLLLFRIWPYMALRVQSLFFVLGGYWSLNKKNLYSEQQSVRIVNHVLTLIMLLTVVRLDCTNSFWGYQFMPLYTLLGMFSAFNLGYLFLQKKPDFRFHQLLSSSSFFVYSLHIEFTLSLGFFLAKTLFRNTQQPLLMTLQYLVTPILIYALSVAIFWAMQKFLPQVLKVLNGSR